VPATPSSFDGELYDLLCFLLAQRLPNSTSVDQRWSIHGRMYTYCQSAGRFDVACASQHKLTIPMHGPTTWPAESSLPAFHRQLLPSQVLKPASLAPLLLHFTAPSTSAFRPGSCAQWLQHLPYPRECLCRVGMMDRACPGQLISNRWPLRCANSPAH
jgi:hypothetical protein